MSSMRLDQALAASSFSRPDAYEGWVKGHLHLILQIQISVWPQGKHISQVGGKLIPFLLASSSTRPTRQREIWAHTLFDGDPVFALTRAVIKAVRSTTALHGMPAVEQKERGTI